MISAQDTNAKKARSVFHPHSDLDTLADAKQDGRVYIVKKVCIISHVVKGQSFQIVLITFSTNMPQRTHSRILQRKRMSQSTSSEISKVLGKLWQLLLPTA